MPRTLPRPVDAPNPVAQNMAELGALVRNRRAQSQMRIDDTADAVGISKDVLSRLENGGSVGLEKLFKVLDGLGLCMLVVTKREAMDAVRALHSGSRETL